MASGSGFIEALRECMLVKQDAGYRVTLQTVLIELTELEAEERDGESDPDSGDSVLDSWIRRASIKPMIRVKKRAEKIRDLRMILERWRF